MNPFIYGEPHNPEECERLERHERIMQTELKRNAVRDLNIALEAFDQITMFQYDKVTDPKRLAVLADRHLSAYEADVFLSCLDAVYGK